METSFFIAFLRSLGYESKVVTTTRSDGGDAA
jgi:hypothetical protein